MKYSAYCAIGDIHGELERLKDLHRSVLEHASINLPDTVIQFIHLGDLIDRGPDSCGVIDYLIEFERARSPRPLTLRGNHEQMMIDAHESPDVSSTAAALHWNRSGGAETLASYSGKPAHTVETHLAWIRSLPTLHQDAAAGLIFVHAGIDPDLYPDCGPDVHMWTRKIAFMDPRCWTAPALRGQRVIHGHTPTQDWLPQSADGGRRLNIDTGAVYGGRLTAAILRRGMPDLFLHS